MSRRASVRHGALLLAAVSVPWALPLSAGDAVDAVDAQNVQQSARAVTARAAGEDAFGGELVIEGTVSLAEAVQMAFMDSPDLQIARARVRGAAGALMEARGPFDRSYFFSADHERQRFEAEAFGVEREEVELRTQTLGVGVTQLFRSGIEVTPSLQLRSEGVTRGAAEGFDPNVGVIRIDASVPLLPLGQRQRFTSQERASERELGATRQEQARSNAEKAFEVVEAYWLYSAAHEYYRLSNESEQRTRELLEQVEELIAADEVAAVQADSVRATLETRTLLRLLAAEDVIVARNQLATAIGLSPEQAVRLPRPVDTFARVDPQQLPGPGQHRALVDRALEQRRDLTALGEREQAAFEVMQGARLERGAGLDLDLFVSYQGERTGRSSSDYLGTLREIDVGPSIGIGLNYAFAPAQRSQDGIYRQRAAERDEVTILHRELRRRIATDLNSTLTSLRQAALRAQQAERAVELHRRAVSREMDRHRLGQVAITEILRANDELADAEQTMIGQRAGFSVTLATVLLALEEIVVPDPDAAEGFHFALARVLGHDTLSGAIEAPAPEDAASSTPVEAATDSHENAARVPPAPVRASDDPTRLPQP